MVRTLFLISLLFVIGCSRKGFELDFMPAPELYADHDITPVTDTVLTEFLDTTLPGLLYVTNRAPAEDPSKFPFYITQDDYILHTGLGQIAFTNSDLTYDDVKEAASDSALSGKYQVYVPSVMPLDDIKGSAHPLIYGTESDTLQKNSQSAFLKELNIRLHLSKKRSVTLFIHGFRVGFTYPILFASQMSYMDGFEDVFIAFSWPASSKGYTSYFKDSESALASARDFWYLLEYLAKNSEAEEINVIAHSAGTKVAIGAMNQIALMNHDKSSEEIFKTYKINQVILLSGDATMDQLLGHPHDNIARVAQHVAIYQSEDDVALKVSQRLQKHRRIGQVFSDQEPTDKDYFFIETLKKYQDKLEIINATQAAGATKGIGHSYFWKSPWVSSDIIMLLRYGLPAAKRGLVYNDTWGVWEFDATYPQRLNALIKSDVPATQK